MRKIEYAPDALEKIGAIYRYISEELQNPGGASNTVGFIREKVRALRTSPQMGRLLVMRFDGVPERFMHVRYYIFGDYIAIYEADESVVRVLRIFHGKQDYVQHLFRD
ncbi:MAG: type II toxin-antitoxin system RelE/ParE family toxin [Clostridiales Family XIII bacterium]|jgi:plasmid stabilization system protein ParE|nr:type II toxin-antitoxin system RelE/ParE family toxin [Clostridiales Family XIII bacterium]